MRRARLQHYVDTRVAEFERRLDGFVSSLEALRRETSGANQRLEALADDAERLRQEWLLAQLELTQLLRRGQ